MTQKNIYKDILFGVAIGDALGVPVEFESRRTVQQKPVTDIQGFGTYNLPAGTFSDDSSLTFCLAEALTQEFNLHTIATNFSDWFKQRLLDSSWICFLMLELLQDKLLIDLTMECNQI